MPPPEPESQRGRATHILHVDYGMGFGGSIVSLSELVRGLEATPGVTCTVVSFQPLEALSRLFPTATVVRERVWLSYQDRARMTAFFQRGRWWSWLRRPAFRAYALLDGVHDWWLGRQLARVGRERGATVLHANNGWSLSALRAARTLDVPCLVHFRGYEASAPSESAAQHIARRSRSVHQCIGIAPAVSASLVASGIPVERVATIENPVSLKDYDVPAHRAVATRTRLGFSDDHFVLGVFGRIIPFKGQLEFLEAVAPLFAEWLALRVMIVGDESDLDIGTYGRRVRALAAEPSHASRVVFTGYQEQVADFYAACDVVIHCSVHPEPFGRVVIEGMAAGKPVLAMDEGGPPGIIEHEVDGVLVTPRDPEAMRQALRQLRANPAAREALGASGRATVQARYSPEVAANRFLALLQKAPSR